MIVSGRARRLTRLAPKPESSPMKVERWRTLARAEIAAVGRIDDPRFRVAYQGADGAWLGLDRRS